MQTALRGLAPINARYKTYCGCCCVRVLHPINSYGHTEMGPRFKVPSERLEKPGIEPTTPGLQGEWLYNYTTEAFIYCGSQQFACIGVNTIRIHFVSYVSI